MKSTDKHLEEQWEEPIETLIRVAEPRDSKAILGLLRHVGRETPYLTLNSEDESMTVEQQRQLIEHYNDAPRSIMIVAESDDQLVGLATVVQKDTDRQSHVAEIGVSIVQDYWGYGIGTVLTEEMIAFAQHAGLKVLTLEVVSENLRAIKLYEKFGFKIVGQLSQRLKHGFQYFDTYVMERLIED